MSDEAEGNAQLQRLAAEERFEELETRWLDELARPVPAERFLAAIAALPEGQHRRVGAPLLALLLEACQEHKAHGDALAVAEVLLPLRPRGVDLGEAIRGALNGLHGDEDWFRAFGELSGLDDADGTLSGALSAALQRFRQLMRLLPGRPVYHPSGWGEGVVTQCDLPHRSFTVRFAKSGLERSMPFLSGLDVLTALDDDDLRGRLLVDLEGLRAEAAESPALVLRAVTRLHQGRATSRDCKRWLAGTVIAEKSWASWWRKAKVAAGRDPWLAVDNPSRPTFRLRKQPRAPEEELRGQFDRARDLGELVEIAQGTLALEPSDDVKRLGLDRVADGVDDATAEPICRLEGVLLLLRHGGRDLAWASERLDRMLREGARFGALTQGLRGVGARKEAFELLVHGRPQLWSDAVIGDLPGLHPTLLDTVFDRLVAAGRGEALSNRFHIFLLSPSRQPIVTLRLARRFRDGFFTGIEGAPTTTEVVGGLLRLVETQAPRAARGDRRARDVMEDLEPLLSPAGHPLLVEFGEHGTRSDLEGALGVLARCPSMSTDISEAVQEVVSGRFPDLAPAEEAFWERGGLFCTRDGIARRREELRELMNDKIPANAADIGRAAAYGDLSENFEWQAAIDRQRQLTEKAAAVEAELKLVRPIEEQVMEPGVVAPGTRVTYAQDGAEHTVSILGPWDSAAGVVSYRAPLAAGMLGARAGETVTVELPTGLITVTVRAIETLR